MTIIVAISLFGLVLQLICVRGKQFHNHLVHGAAKDLEHEDFLASLEVPIRLPDGRTDFVDVLATRDTQVVACEVETSARHALFNIERARELGLPLIVLVPTRRVCHHIRRKLVQAGPTDRIWILLPDQLSQVVRDCFPRIPAAYRAAENKKTA